MILGLDPSFSATGWAVLSNRHSVKNAGIFPGPKSEVFEVRLKSAHEWIASILNKYVGIEIVGIEQPFFARNPKTFYEQAALVTIYRYEAYESGKTVHMVHPSQRFKPFGIKPRGGKEQLRKTINLRFDLKIKPKDHDVSDAIAVAVTAAERGK